MTIGVPDFLPTLAPFCTSYLEIPYFGHPLNVGADWQFGLAWSREEAHEPFGIEL